MLAAELPDGVDAGDGAPSPPGAGVVVEFAGAPIGAGSGLPMLTAGAAPRADPAEGKLAGETGLPTMRSSRGFSGVGVSPPATGAVPAAEYEAGIGGGIGGSGPDDAGIEALLAAAAVCVAFGVERMPKKGSPGSLLPQPLSQPAIKQIEEEKRRRGEEEKRRRKLDALSPFLRFSSSPLLLFCIVDFSNHLTRLLRCLDCRNPPPCQCSKRQMVIT